MHGCVTVYQPLSGFHRPVAANPEIANFPDVRIDVRCVPEDFLGRSGAELLCRKVGTLLSNQGAKVVAYAERDPTLDEEPEPSEAAGPPDLVIELRARLLHKERNGLLWVISFASLTILPAISEYSFAQDVTIRDASGFLLIKDSLSARFTRYFGVGTWFLNLALDWTVREEHEKLSGSAINRDFSRDFYGQLTQLAFNALQRHRVLGLAQESVARAQEQN